MRSPREWLTVLTAAGILVLSAGLARAQIPQIVAETRFNTEPVCSSPGLPSPSDCINCLLGPLMCGLEDWTFPICPPPGLPRCPHPGEPLPCQGDVFTFWANHDGNVPPSPGDTFLDGYARSIDAGPRNPGWMCGPNSFLGDWSQLDTSGQLCFDIRVFQTDTSRGVCTGDPTVACGGCHPACPAGLGPCDTSVHRAIPYNVTIEGFRSGGGPMSVTWEGAVPLGVHSWTTIEVPIDRTAGWGETKIEPTGSGIKRASATVPSAADWTSLLGNVTHLEVKTELFDNCAINDERTGVDNIVLGNNLLECRECLIDFERPLMEGTVIEGAFAVHPNLTIVSGTPLGTGSATVVRTAAAPPGAYGAPNNMSSLANNCLQRNQGFADITSVAGSVPPQLPNGRAHQYQFVLNNPVNEFSLRVLDFGDFNPLRASNHRMALVGLCPGGFPFFDVDILTYPSDGMRNPVTSVLFPTCSLQTIGDACGAQCATTPSVANPGNRTLRVQCPGMTQAVLTFPWGYDPNIGLDCINFK